MPGDAGRVGLGGMSAPLPGKPTSLWLDTTPATTYEPLPGDLSTDVCVIGAGITGLTAALSLKQAGRRVVVVEMDRVAQGVTGYTTGKVSALHGLHYGSVRSRFGADGARAYAAANQAGLELIARFVRDLDIDCDFRRKPNVTYTEDPAERETIVAEVDAAVDAGLAAAYTEETDLPWPVAGAIRVPDQAEFHAPRYLLALAGAVHGDGSAVHERTRAVSVSDGEPCRVVCDHGEVTASEVIVATHYPMLDRGLFFARLAPERSYALACRVRGAVPQGMYLSSESPAHSVRSAPLDGEELLLVGGESHKTGQGGETPERYRALEAWARERFDVTEVVYRWSTQDAMPADGMPYVGRVSPVSRHVWTGTGYRKWGLTNGSAAALMLTDAICGRENPWAGTFDANRFKPLAAGGTLVKENFNVGVHFLGDRLAPPDADSLDALAPGEGGIVVVDGDRTAAYRDEDGTVHLHGPACTHLGCHVTFNAAERSWDCPCHGSRFDATDGRVLQGPAVRDLERRDS
jgi:glycine/D-amino acid oxidase-like deaminating enzyme/nitrite reductase/ring-hydroxylating ferredoxin subunit